MSRRSDVAVLQDVLAAEHAVVYGYGVAGARLRGAARARAERGWTAHRSGRDALEQQLSDLAATPVAPAPAYALPSPVTNADEAVLLITLLEERLAAVWADAVAGLDGELRRQAIEGLTAAAVSAARWRGGSVPFPGLPERA